MFYTIYNEHICTYKCSKDVFGAFRLIYKDTDKQLDSGKHIIKIMPTSYTMLNNSDRISYNYNFIETDFQLFTTLLRSEFEWYDDTTHSLYLQDDFRSKPKLIKTNNDLFQAILYAHDNKPYTVDIKIELNKDLMNQFKSTFENHKDKYLEYVMEHVTKEMLQMFNSKKIALQNVQQR